ncbi:hypothetical protein U1Q18_045373 [Sarracenia purpurea var. burkii]
MMSYVWKSGQEKQGVKGKEFSRGEGRPRQGFKSDKIFNEMNLEPKGVLIQANVVETNWLNSCVVAITKNMKCIPVILEEMCAEGVLCIKVKPLGGEKVLLQSHPKRSNPVLWHLKGNG